MEAAMRPMGPGTPQVGETLISLPTLIHRGPGNRSAGAARKVLFFALRPVYGDDGKGGAASEEQVGSYDDGTQIHVGWLLSRPGYGLDPKRRREVLVQYKRHGVDLEGFAKGGEARLEV